ncbi:hypothetical protein [Luteolibacter sp. AS25]
MFQALRIRMDGAAGDPTARRQAVSVNIISPTIVTEVHATKGWDVTGHAM